MSMGVSTDIMWRCEEMAQRIGRFYKTKVCSSILIDPKKMFRFWLLDERQGLNPMYIDLSLAVVGDYERAMEHFVSEGYDGFIFDNIDEISSSCDRELWEQLLRWALKREDRCPVSPMWTSDIVLNFSEIGVVARCRELPPFLSGVDLLSIIDVLE